MFSSLRGAVPRLSTVAGLALSASFPSFGWAQSSAPAAGPSASSTAASTRQPAPAFPLASAAPSVALIPPSRPDGVTLPAFPGTVPVWLSSRRPGAVVLLSLSGQTRPFASCRDECGLWVYPGRYIVSVPDTGELLGGAQPVRVRQKSIITVEPRTNARRTTGILVGVSGIVVAAMSVALLVARAAGNVDSEGAPSDDLDVPTLVGASGLLVGFGMTGYGFASAGSTPDVRVREY